MSNSLDTEFCTQALKEAIASLTAGFPGKQEQQQNDHAAEVRELQAKIGQLTVEKDFLADVSRRLGVLGGKR